MKIYSVFKNTGDWGGHSWKIVIADSIEDAKTKVFWGRTKEEKKAEFDKYIAMGGEVVAKLINKDKYGEYLVQKIIGIEDYDVDVKITPKQNVNDGE